MIELRGSYSIYARNFLWKIDDVDYDLSGLVPDSVWEIAKTLPYHPEEDWKIRIELRKIFIKWFKENIDKNIDETKIVVF